MDRVSKATRREIMRANRAKDTGPELTVRKALFARGFRYRLHDSRLPGKPDVVLRKHHVAIFINGCYWHGHSCWRKPRAKSNEEFWQAKVSRNRQRDLAARNQLLASGWRVLVVWECAVRRRKHPLAESPEMDYVAAWLHGRGRLAMLTENGFEECL